MTKQGFMSAAQPIQLTVGGVPAVATPKRFSPEKPAAQQKVGYNISAKVAIPLPGGTKIAQFSGNLIIVGSQDWPENDTLAISGPAASAGALAGPGQGRLTNVA